MMTIVEETLHPAPYDKKEVLKELDVTEDELNGTSLTPNTTHIQQFKLRDRALHVFSGTSPSIPLYFLDGYVIVI